MKTLHTLVCLSAVILINQPLFAQNRTWNNSDGGDFNTPSNWTSPVVPGETNGAFFTLPNTYTVSFSGDVDNDTFRVTNGTVTFDLNGNDYSIGANGFFVGRDNSADLEIQNGTLKSIGPANIGYTAGKTGNLILSNSNLQWTPGSSGTFFVGRQGNGSLTVQNGSSFSSSAVNREVVIGADGATGTVKITGSGSSFSHTGALTRIGGRAGGSAGTGTLEVLAGGTASIAELWIAEHAATSVGTVLVSGADSALTATTISVAGSSTAGSGGEGNLTVTDGGRISADNIIAWDTATISFSNSLITADSLALHSSTLALTLFSEAEQPLINISGNVDLGNTTLDLSLDASFVSTVGRVYEIIDYEGTLVGTFSGLDDNSRITVGSYEFELNYGSGTGDSLTLTTIAIPESGSIGLTLGLIASVCLLGRRLFRLHMTSR